MKPGSSQKNSDVRLINQTLNKHTPLQSNGSRIAQNPYQNNTPSKSVEQHRIRIISQQPARAEDLYYNLQNIQKANQSHQQQPSTVSNDASFLDEGPINSYNDSQRSASGMNLRCPLCPNQIQCYELKLNSISYHSYCIQKIIDEQIQQNKYPIKDPREVIIQDEFIKSNFPPFFKQISQYRIKYTSNIKVNYMPTKIENQKLSKAQYGDMNQRSNEKPIADTDRTSNCVICNTQSSRDILKQLPCQHHVHIKCLSLNKFKILQKQLQCSNCKTTLKTNILRLAQIPIPEDYFQDQIKQIQQRYAHVFQKCQSQSCTEFWFKTRQDEKFCYLCQIRLGSRIQAQEKPRSISHQEYQPQQLIESRLKQGQLYKTQNYLLSDSGAFKTARSEICFYCNQSTGFQFITLACQHCYHSDCLNIVVNQQVKEKSKTVLICICNAKIYMSTLRSILQNDIAMTQLVDNQYKSLQLKYIYFQKCKSKTCSFFFVKGQTRSYYCPHCIEFYS